MIIRKLLNFDIEEVLAIQKECYKENLLESSASFSEKLAAAPDFCLLALKEGVAIGYLVALPWKFGEILPLNEEGYFLCSKESLCIHDMAVSPRARNEGVGKALVETFLRSVKEKNYNRIFLVSVQGAFSYWQRYGFKAVQVGQNLQKNLQSYGTDAQYMVKIEK